MAFRCCINPKCATLLHLAERGVPHHGKSHNTVYDYTRLAYCSACRGGLLEHHSHDCWDSGDHSSWDMYWWWRIDPTDMPAVLEVAHTCPASLDPKCRCPVHRGLGESSPPSAVRPVETVYDKATVPRVNVQVIDGIPRWVDAQGPGKVVT
jgi:hypothetical protein